MKTVLFVLILLLAGTGFVSGQAIPVDTTNGKSYYILLKDGSHIHGRIVKRDSTMYTVRMKNGQLTYVETALFGQISASAPTTADTAAYFTQSNYSRPDVSQPMQTTVSPSQYEITLTDGTTLNATVLSQDSSRVVVKTEALGTVYIPARRVVRMERVRTADEQAAQQRNASAGSPNLFPQYLNFTPTAFQAERGRVYYRNTLVYFNQFDVGVTDNWSIGMGVSLLPNILFGWLSTKLSVPIGPKARIGIQGQVFTGGGAGNLIDRSFQATYIQTVLSLGESQNNITVGLGVNVGQNSSGQIITVAYVKKVSPLVTFISENQLLLNTGGSTTVGKLGGAIRFDRQRHSFDLSINVPLLVNTYSSRSATFFAVLPMVSYQVRLGN